MESKVIQLPPELDDEIAGLQLDAMGFEIDELTQEQKDYLDSWEEGT